MENFCESGGSDSWSEKTSSQQRVKGFWNFVQLQKPAIYRRHNYTTRKGTSTTPDKGANYSRVVTHKVHAQRTAERERITCLSALTSFSSPSCRVSATNYIYKYTKGPKRGKKMKIGNKDQEKIEKFVSFFSCPRSPGPKVVNLSMTPLGLGLHVPFCEYVRH